MRTGVVSKWRGLSGTSASVAVSLVGVLVSRLEVGDLVLCLGAGSVGSMPEKLLKALDARVDLPIQIAGDAIVGAVVGA